MIYATVLLFITINGFRKKKNWIYCLLWTLYASSGVFCCVAEKTYNLNNTAGRMQRIWYDLSDTTLYGYALIIICTYIAFIPLKKFDDKNSLQYFGKSGYSKQVMRLFSYIYIFAALFFLLLSYKDVIRILNINDFGTLRSTLYGNSENESTLVVTNNFIASLCLKICLQFKWLSIFISFALIKEKKTKLAITLLGLTFFVYLVNSSANASRGGMAVFLFCAILIFTFFTKYLTEKNKKSIKKIALILMGITIAFFLSVSVSRFASTSSSNSSRVNLIISNLVFYLGHGPIEFSKITGSLKHFAYGGVILGRLSKHYFGTPYSWTDIQSKIGYPNIGAVFNTYLGYLYTDFGAIGCLTFVGLWSCFMTRVLRNRPNNLSTIYMFLYYISYYVSGNFAVGRLEYAALITTFTGYFILRIIERTRKSRKL